MNHNLPTGQQLARENRQFAREVRERRISRVRGAIKVNCYDTARKLDEGLEKLLDSEGFSSHPPVLRADDAALNDWMDEQMRLLTETDR